MPINNQIVGGNFTDAQGNVLANGTLVFQLSQDEQTSAPGHIGAGRKITVNLDNTGNVPVSPAVYLYANDVLNPANSFYLISAYSASGQLVWGPQKQQILSSPSPFNVSALVPNSVVSTAVPAPIPQLRTNGVLNGSQTKFNAVAGSGMTITDDGSGDVTFAASGGASSSLAISSAAAPATVNLTSEGTVDWIVTTGQNFSGGQPNVGGSTFLWKKKGSGFTIQRTFHSYYSDPSIPPAGGANNINGGVAFTATAGDAVYPAGSAFSNGPPPVSLAAYIQISASPTAGGGYGYQFTIPAVSTTRTLRLYMTVQGITGPNQALVTAHMLDGSIADQTATVTDSGTGGIGTPYKVTITYKAASSSPMIVSVELTGGATVGALAFLGMTIA